MTRWHGWAVTLFAVFALVLLRPGAALAETQASTGGVQYALGSSGWLWDKASTCSSYADQNTALNTSCGAGGHLVFTVTASSSTCQLSKDCSTGGHVGNTSDAYSTQGSGSPSCPDATWLLDSGAHTCTRPTCTKGTIHSGFVGRLSGVGTLNVGGCEYAVAFASNGYMLGGVRGVFGTWIEDGVHLPYGTADDSGWNGGATPDLSCPDGKVPSLILGVGTCVNASATLTLDKISGTITSGSGSTVTDTVTVSSNTGGGTVTTTTSGTGSASSAVTLTPTSTSGSATGSSDQAKFCVENPTSPICKVSGGVGGSCGAFSCDGDAVQCAIALEAYQTRCDLFTTTTTLSTLGSNAAAGSDPLASTFPANNVSTVDVSAALDQSRLVSGGCLSDTSFTVMGHTLAIPWSNLCTVLGYMGLIVVAFSMLSAAKIVGVV